MKYFDKLKDYLNTSNSIRQNVEQTSNIEKVEESEDVKKSEIELGDSYEYCLSRNVKIEEGDDDGFTEAKIRTNTGKIQHSYLYNI